MGKAASRILFLLLVLFGVFSYYRWSEQRTRSTTVPVELARQLETKEVKAADQQAFSSDETNNIQIYRMVSPAVVNITTTTVEYDWFFMPMPRQGAGSGFIIDSEGHIVTNNHVIEGARSLEVTLADKSKFRARVIGTDPPNDLAVLKIETKKKLETVKLGDSSNLQVGQKVLAIGNPFGLEGTLTTGIISSLGRSIRAETGQLIENVIQTDASINPGNSGGPLLNARGEVIGINTAIVSPSGGSVGVGFAIPVNSAKTILADLIREGRVRRPFLGVRGYVMDRDLAEALDLPVDHGLLVARVERGSSAERAGLRGGSELFLVGNRRMILGGDLVVAIDNQEIREADDVSRYVEKKRPGDSITVTLYRGRRKMTLTVNLLERPPA